jgi:HAD superfamily 5'-nucleotidase-like hydrolase
MNHPVFVNRTLNMKKIKYIGLDMDHTLIRYKTENFETLVYRLVIEELITNQHYPEEIKQLQFNFTDAIRGLVIDSKNGNILKLSRYGAIRQSYHGTKQIDFNDQKSIYRSIYVDLGDPNYMAIDTSFSIAFCVLYQQLVDYKDRRPNDYPDYNVIATNVLHAVDRVHAAGHLKQQICKDLDRYVIKDKELVMGMRRYIQHGKKIFILTNSETSIFLRSY